MTFVSISKVKHATIITLCRPERMNALGSEVGSQLQAAIDEVKRELLSARKNQYESPRCLLLRAEPVVKQATQKKFWIAGGDLKELKTLKSKEEGDTYSQIYRSLVKTICDLPIPTIAALDGQAIGGGAELLLAADIRIATQDSSLHFKQLAMGLTTGYSGAARLAQIVGPSLAKYLLLMTKTMTAQQALEKGVLHELCQSSEELESRSLEALEHFETLDPQAVKAQKAILSEWAQGSVDQAITKERKQFKSIWQEDGHRRALEAFTR